MSKNKNFCIRPFVSGYIQPGGAFSPCCKIHEGFGNTQSNTLSELWSSKEMASLRESFQKGERHHACQECWNFEDKGLPSERLSQGNQELEKQYQELPHQPSIKRLEFRLSNKCNLACRMCHPGASSLWSVENEKWKLYPQNRRDKNHIIETFKDELEILEHIKPFISDLSYIKIHGGEPLIEEQFYKLLEILRPFKENIEIDFMSNLMVPNLERLNIDLLKNWKKLSMTISLDGPPEINEYIRKGLKTPLFEQNYHQLRKSLGGENIRVFFHATLQALNIGKIPSFIEYIKKLSPDRLTFSQVQFPKELSTAALAQEYREKAFDELLNYEKTVNLKGLSKELEHDLKLLIQASKVILSEAPDKDQEGLYKGLQNWNRVISNKEDLPI